MAHKDYQAYISTLLQDPSEEANFFSTLDKSLNKSLHLLQSRISTADFLKHNPDRTLSKTPHEPLQYMYYVDRSDRSLPLGSTRWHQAGYYYIQEVAASIPAHFVDITPNAFILDMCSAPGGKSIQLADRMAREQPDAIGCVWSNDVDPKRIVVLQANLNRCGFSHSAVSKINGASFGNVFPETFDSILLDAPCSGEGTGYKSASAYARWSEKGVRDIANLQESLLHSAAKSCKVGGSIIYSTCTINHRENESQIKRLLETYPDSFEIEDVSMTSSEPALTHYQGEEMISDDAAKQCIRCRPHRQSSGGFFVVKFRKIKSIAKPYTFDKAHSKQSLFSTPLTHSRGQDRKISKWLEESFGIEIDPAKHTFVSTSKKIFLTSPTLIPFLSKARFEKVGIPIAKILKSKRTGETSYLPLQHLANTIGHLATHHIIDLPCEQAQAYTEGESLDTEDLEQTIADREHYLITTLGLPLSVAKVVDGKIKNKFIGV